jgi:ketosteroid isomerase-like protein
MLILALALSTATADDKAAVRAAEDGWNAAYISGDTDFLDHLLANDYVSVSGTGSDRDKTANLASARSYAAAHPGAVNTPLPPSSTIAITGDLAIVRHHGTKDVSVDIFQKREGRWIAVYSQHTPLPAG